MNQSELIRSWLHEEQIARIHGWDFSHIDGRYEESPLPWSYRDTVLRFLRPEMKLLDLDTGGGEFLLSLGHPHENTAATEGFPPNVRLCRDVLLPLGVDFQAAQADGPLPFADSSFDLVVNRHGSFHPPEIHRILKPHGLFITQQVGADNDRELVEALYAVPPTIPYPNQHLKPVKSQFKSAGFDLLETDECFVPIRFFDVGALVWFAKIIEWEFPGFSVEGQLSQLLSLQERLNAGESIEGRAHRFLLVVRKN